VFVSERQASQVSGFSVYSTGVQLQFEANSIEKELSAAYNTESAATTD